MGNGAVHKEVVRRAWLLQDKESQLDASLRRSAALETAWLAQLGNAVSSASRVLNDISSSEREEQVAMGALEAMLAQEDCYQGFVNDPLGRSAEARRVLSSLHDCTRLRWQLCEAKKACGKAFRLDTPLPLQTLTCPPRVSYRGGPVSFSLGAARGAPLESDGYAHVKMAALAALQIKLAWAAAALKRPLEAAALNELVDVLEVAVSDPCLAEDASMMHGMLERALDIRSALEQLADSATAAAEALQVGVVAIGVERGFRIALSRCEKFDKWLPGEVLDGARGLLWELGDTAKAAAQRAAAESAAALGATADRENTKLRLLEAVSTATAAEVASLRSQVDQTRRDMQVVREEAEGHLRDEQRSRHEALAMNARLALNSEAYMHLEARERQEAEALRNSEAEARREFAAARLQAAAVAERSEDIQRLEFEAWRMEREILDLRDELGEQEEEARNADTAWLYLSEGSEQQAKGLAAETAERNQATEAEVARYRAELGHARLELRERGDELDGIIERVRPYAHEAEARELAKCEQRVCELEHLAASTLCMQCNTRTAACRFPRAHKNNSWYPNSGNPSQACATTFNQSASTELLLSLSPKLIGIRNQCDTLSAQCKFSSEGDHARLLGDTRGLGDNTRAFS